MPKVNIKVDKLLRDFIIGGGFDIQTDHSAQTNTVYYDFVSMDNLKVAEPSTEYGISKSHE